MTRQHFGVIFGGILLLVVAMGISRFAFTPILPFMREDEGFSLQVGGWLASSNYIGYFVGSLVAGFIYNKKREILTLNIVFNVLSIVAMGLTSVLSLWLILRFIAGLTGGIIFVLTSSIVMDYLAANFLTKWSGFVFSGIGLGIAISGLVVPIFENAIAWQGTWLGLGVISTFFVIVTFVLWRNLLIQTSEKVAPTNETNIWRGFMPWLIIAYGLEGFGYIITGTFLVDIIYNIESLRAYAGYSWVVAGLAAVPSAPLWVTLMTKFSPVKAMSLAYILQTFGILLPVFSQTAWSVLLSAFLFGMTFVGLVSMSTGYARQLFPKQSGMVVSILTTFYAFGQIIGPLLASKLEATYDSYKAPLLLAGAVVFLALLVLLVGKAFSASPAKKTIASKV